jgi:glycosyltransferase involved in cell wall biosynthesis
MTEPSPLSMTASEKAPSANPQVRALFLLPSLVVGGAERQAVTLAEGLRRAGHVAEIALLSAEGGLCDGARAAGIPLHDLGRRARWMLPLALARFVRLCERFRPDVIHSFLPVPNLAVATMRPLLRRARIVWGFRTGDLDWSMYGKKAQFAFALETRLSTVPDLIIFNSHVGLRHCVEKGFPAARSIAVQNGVDCSAFRVDRALGADLRARWGASSCESVVGLVGRVDPVKNHRGFLEAVALLRDRQPRVRFVCIGQGSSALVAELQALAERLGIADRVVWAGALRDMPAAYNALDLLVLPSLSEAFPNAVAEAMACGVSCVATDVGDVKLLVAETGRVVRTGDARALADGIAELLSLSREEQLELAAAARRRVVEHFSADTLIGRTLDVLRGSAARAA